MTPRTGRVCRMQMLLFPNALEELRGKTCRRAQQPVRRRFEPPVLNPALSEWVAGRLRRARRLKTAALSVVFAKAERHGRKVIMDFPAWAQPGVEAVARRAAAEAVAAVAAEGVDSGEKEQ